MAEAASQRDRLIEEVFETLCLGVLIWELEEASDPSSLVLRLATSSASSILGVDLANLLGRRISEVLPSVDPSHVRTCARICIEKFQHDFGTAAYRGQNGTEFALSARPILDRGVLLLVDAPDSDKAGQRAARRLERFLDSIVEHIPAMVFMKDAETLKFERFNRAGEELLGVEREALLGRSDYDFFPKPQADFFVAKDREVLARGVLEDIPEEPIETARGTRWLHTRKIPLIDEDGLARHLLGVSIDITERKRAEDALRASNEKLAKLVRDRTEELEREIEERKRAELALTSTEEQLRHSQKMDAIGRLAGGVAHDFNNLLSVILSYTSLVRGALPEGDARSQDLAEVLRAAERAVDLTRQLLAFSRRQMLQPRVVNLNEVVTRLEHMLCRVIGEDIVLSTRTASDLRPVRVDVNQIEQALLNLAVNAREAMPQGGRLTIETENIDLDERDAGQALELSAGSYVVLSVCDTGIGMDHETRQRIFEPFFSTKEQSKGTGLGLSTVFGMIKQSGGSITVDSALGSGSTFRLYIPIAVATAAEPEPRRPLLSGRGGGEKILVVEDEEAVRRVVVGILRRGGYAVFEAANAESALGVFQEHGASINLLLTDVVMPGMSGPDLARNLRELKPEISVLCMSGYTEDAVLSHGILQANFAFVQKPLLPNVLLRKVRQVLDADASNRPSP